MFRYKKDFIQQYAGVVALACCCLWIVIAIGVFQRWDLTPCCIIRSISGYECPACGIQRMIAYLLHGKIHEAFWSNPYIFLISPYLLTLFVSILLKRQYSLRLKTAVRNRFIVIFLATLMIAWWIFRNTSFFHAIAAKHIPQ